MQAVDTAMCVVYPMSSIFKQVYFASDLNECLSNPCQNHGTCQNQIGGYSCKCHDGYAGPICNIGTVVRNIIV